MQFRWDIINYLIKNYSLKTYLEIGMNRGDTIHRVNAEERLSLIHI